MQPPAEPGGVQVVVDDEDEAEKVYDVEPAVLVAAPAEAQQEKHPAEIVRVVEGADGTVVELVELDVPDVPAVQNSLLVLSDLLSQLLGRYELRLKEERAVTERLKAQRDAVAALVQEARVEKGRLENDLAALEVEAYRASKSANRSAAAYGTPSFGVSEDSAEVTRPKGAPPVPPVASAMGQQPPASQALYVSEENGGNLLAPVRRKNKIGAGAGTGVGSGAQSGAFSAGSPDRLPAPSAATAVERLSMAAPAPATAAAQVPYVSTSAVANLEGSSGAKKKNKISR